MAKGKIIIISGPSGSGKTTLHKKLMASPKFKSKLAKSVSVTTRPKRKGERSGRDYFFVSPERFLYKKRSNHFLESEKVFGNHYGTPRAHVEKLLRQGKHVLMCIDVKGARVVREKFPKAVTIFIKAPSLSVLASRLRERQSEGKSVVRLRLETARKELKEAKKYKHVVVNDRLEAAYRKLELIIKGEIKPSSQKQP